MSHSAHAELELFRQRVNCAAVLERMVGCWKFDQRESTRRALKYRRGEGEIIIVNHDGRGRWDAIGSPTTGSDRTANTERGSRTVPDVRGEA